MKPSATVLNGFQLPKESQTHPDKLVATSAPVFDLPMLKNRLFSKKVDFQHKMAFLSLKEL